jgi:hypothetical protein
MNKLRLILICVQRARLSRVVLQSRIYGAVGVNAL